MLRNKNILNPIVRVCNPWCFFSFLDSSSKDTDAPVSNFSSLCGVKVVVEVIDSESNFSILVTLADKFKYSSSTVSK